MEKQKITRLIVITTLLIGCVFIYRKCNPSQDTIGREWFKNSADLIVPEDSKLTLYEEEIIDPFLGDRNVYITFQIQPQDTVALLKNIKMKDWVVEKVFDSDDLQTYHFKYKKVLKEQENQYYLTVYYDPKDQTLSLEENVF